MYTKFHQNPSSGSGEEVENVKSLHRTDGRTDGRTTTTTTTTTTTDGRRTDYYDNSSLELCSGELKNCVSEFLNFLHKVLC